MLPKDLSAGEMREALRSLKGSMLRQEIYALDGTEEADRLTLYPSATHHQTLAATGHQQYAVFFTHSREMIDFHYERRLYKVSGGLLCRSGPPVSECEECHGSTRDPSITLAVDDYGNVLQVHGYRAMGDDSKILHLQEDQDTASRRQRSPSPKTAIQMPF